MHLVILPGWGHGRNIWKSFSEMVRFNLTVLDLPGFGNEKLINDSWGVPEYSLWVEKKIKYNNVILLGHSFGGRIAARIASKKPKWLKGLILTDAPCIYQPTTKTKFTIQITKALKYFFPNKIRQILLSYDLKEAQKLGMEKVFRKVVSYDQSKELKKISVPTLLIWGNEDNEVPLKIAYEINDLINRSTLIIIEKAGHNCFLDSPYLFYSHVKNFIQNIK